MKYTLPLMLLPGLWLTACGDYYGTTNRYPYTRTRTESHVYRYTTPPRSYPVQPPSYEINNHYYGYPVAPKPERPRFRDHEEAYRPDIKPYIKPYDTRPGPDGDRPDSRAFMPGNASPERTFGQQEFDKKMEQLRQNRQNMTRIQPQPESNPASPLERIRQRREQKMDVQQSRERAEKPGSNSPSKNKRQAGNPAESGE